MLIKEVESFLYIKYIFQVFFFCKNLKLIFYLRYLSNAQVDVKL